MLTRAVGHVGLETAEPIECYRGAYRPEHDLRRPEVLAREVEDIRKGEVDGAHFGTPCESMCSFFQNLGPGTRTSERPEGDGSNAKEVLGNAENLPVQETLLGGFNKR